MVSRPDRPIGTDRTDGMRFAVMLPTSMRGLILTGLFSVLPVALSAQTATWQIDPGHSSAQFAVRHMVIATVHGEFDGPTGTVSFDAKDIAGTLKADATINARSIITRNAERH